MSGGPGGLSRGTRMGAFKPAKAAAPTADDGEALAAAVLGVLAAEPAHLSRFLADSGMAPGDLARSVGDRGTLLAVLEHVVHDESLLLVVAAQLNVRPEAVIAAIDVLQTPAEQSP